MTEWKPEQTKRDRIIAQLSNEFTDVSFQTRFHPEYGLIIVFIAHYSLETEQINQIRSRIEELEAQP